jgi:2-oxoisovalerate dehydrogenase E1 component
MAVETAPKANEILTEETLIKAFELMCCAKSMSVLYEENKEVTAKYVHATSRGTKPFN